MTHYIIQNNIFNEKCFNRLITTLSRFDIPYDIVQCVPFSQEIIPMPTIRDKNVVAIGSYGFTNKARTIWTPGSWTNDNFDYRIWSNAWGKENCLNGDGEVYRFDSVPYIDGDFFIRPCGDDKDFSGHVTTYDKYRIWLKKVVKDRETYTQLNSDTMVLTGPAYKIKSEYRFVIVDGKIVTGSTYGASITQQEVSRSNSELFEFVQTMVDKWTPAPIFCLDIALCGGEYWVLEMGNFNSAGLYECDVQKIIMAIEDYLS